MGFYERRILPRLIDLGMRQKQLAALRERVVGAAQGQVLEVGIGSGRNLPFYRRDVESVLGVDPSEELLAMAQAAHRLDPFPGRAAPGRRRGRCRWTTARSTPWS